VGARGRPLSGEQIQALKDRNGPKDAATVQTGSFNYTASAAERNAENVLVRRNTMQSGAVSGTRARI
jgi:hypothetical protein